MLEQISRSTGVAIAVDPSLHAELGAETVTAALAAGASLEEALRRLLPQHSLVALYEHDRLIEVRVYGAGAVGTGAGTATSRLSRRPNDPAPRVDQAVELDSHRGTRRADAERSDAEAELSVDGAIKALQAEGDTENVARALDVFRDTEAAPLEPLLELAGSDRDADLRSQVFEVLVDRGHDDPRVRAVLQSVAARDRDNDARAAARELLKTLEARQ